MALLKGSSVALLDAHLLATTPLRNIPVNYLLLPRYKKHLFGVSSLLGIISVQTEALNKPMHH